MASLRERRGEASKVAGAKWGVVARAEGRSAELREAALSRCVARGVEEGEALNPGVSREEGARPVELRAQVCFDG